MKIVRIPASQKLAEVTILQEAHGVRTMLTITTAMQSMGEEREYASVEDAEREGMAWAERQSADVLVIKGGISAVVNNL